MDSNSLGRYEIQSEIGRGGMASVYLAFDPRFRRQVAVKVLSPQFLAQSILQARFEREARLIATIEHPAIVPVYDFGEHEGQLYLVMRYMIGGPLSAKLRNEPLSLSRTIQILSQLAPALDVVHARGVVHRDLKPGNILFDGFDNPALSDFGIAYLAEATVQLTGDVVIGTPAYMSPEQVQGNLELDGRSDIYALGVILYEMLTGYQPFRSATPMSTALKHLSEPVPKLCLNRPDLPTELDGILAKAMAKDREGRYANASDLIFDLRALPEGSPLHSTGLRHADMRLAAGLGEREVVDEDTEPEMEGPDGQAAPDSNLPLTPAGDAALASNQISGVAQKETPPVDAAPIKKSSAASLAGAVSTPVPASKPAERIGQTGPLSRRTGFLALGLSGLTLVGLCSLLVLGGLVYQFIIRPGLEAAAVATASPTAPAASTPAAPPTASNTPLPEAAVPLLSDNFSQPAHGWPQSSGEEASYSYQDGAYRFVVRRNDTLYWVTPDDSFADASISVTTTLVSGGDESYYGLLCRLQGNQEFYYMVIRTDGRFTMGRYRDGEFLTLLPGGWTTNPAIHAGNAQNQLRVDCSGEQLRFYANGELLAEARDGNLESGKPGLAAAAIGSGELDVRFDDFLVTKP
jgi:serine/threonine protein kinase